MKHLDAGYISCYVASSNSMAISLGAYGEKASILTGLLASAQFGKTVKKPIPADDQNATDQRLCNNRGNGSYTFRFNYADTAKVLRQSIDMLPLFAI